MDGHVLLFSRLFGEGCVPFFYFQMYLLRSVQFLCSFSEKLILCSSSWALHVLDVNSIGEVGFAFGSGN